LVGLEILVKIDPGKRVEFLQAFEMLKDIDQLNDRRIDLKLFEEVRESNTFLWVEHWDNEESLSGYYRNSKFVAMLGAIDVLGQLIRKLSFSTGEEKKNV